MMSSFSLASSDGGALGMKRIANKNTAMPMGMLMKNIQCHVE